MAWTLSYMRDGRFSDPTFVGLGDAYYAYPRYYLLVAGWFELFGVGLYQGRLLGFLLVFLLIGFSALAARNWYGNRAAVFTAAVMFASAVVMSAARLRHDILLAICVAASLWLHTEAVKREKSWLHLLAGIVMGWGMFGHYHAAGFGVALFAGLYAPRYVLRLRAGQRMPERGAWLYGIGGLIGGLTVLLLQILPDDLAGFLYAFRAETKYSEDAGQFLWAFIGNFITIGFFSIFDFLLIALGTIMALRRRSLPDQSLLIILLVGHLLLAVMASGAIYYYVLPLTPIYGMLVGTIFERRREESEKPNFSPAVLVSFLLLLIPSLGFTLSQPLDHIARGRPVTLPPPPPAQWVLDHVDTDQIVAGDLRYYLWLHDYVYANHLIPDFLYPENLERLTTPEQIWSAVNMDVLIVDAGLPRSYKFFGPLVESGFLQAHQYAAEEQMQTIYGDTTIYAREPG
jgi:4-amino-4-deoxy-L-arabinose transferase-like glycosyltransferase